MLRYLVIFLFFSFNLWASTLSVSSEPKEIYGEHQDNIKIRIGNGGAGPTGILRVLSEDFIRHFDKDFSIAWYQDVSPRTLEQLKNGVIDIALVYERDQAKKAYKEGWATNYKVIFNDHFIIVGPKHNPAAISEHDSAPLAFRKIKSYSDALGEPTFISRNDDSATNTKEKNIWRIVGYQPWQDIPNWYATRNVFPKEALIYADRNKLYTITDWGTWLSNSMHFENLQVLIMGSELLLNPCFGFLNINPSKETQEFYSYLQSERAQKIIAEFGVARLGKPLFTPANQPDF